MTIEQLSTALRDDDPERRRRAVLQGLRLPSDPHLLELLIHALGDEDWRVRKEAAQVLLAREGELAPLPALVGALSQSENIGLRNAALDVLQAFGERAAPALIAALPSVPEHARKFVVEALGEAGGPLVLEQLSQAACSDDVNLAGEAIEALARFGGPVAISVIRGRLAAPDPYLRLSALEALVRCGAKIGYGELAPLLGDRMLRRAALGALGRTGAVEALEPLFGALEESSQKTVAAAALSLVRLMREPQVRMRALPRLRALSQPARAGLTGLLSGVSELEWRRAASELLAHARDESALSPILVQFTLDAASPETLDALREWGEGAVAPLLALSMTLDSAQERAVALELAADLGAVSELSDPQLSDRLRHTLRRALHDHEPAVVAAAARSLRPYVQAEDVTVLVQCALSPDVEVARAAGRVLESLAETERAAVARALPDIEVAHAHGAALASVLAILGGPEALDRLRGLLNSDDSEVRRAALHALSRIGGTRAAELVALSLADEDSHVQVTATQVLGRLRDEHGGVPGVSELLLAARSEHAHVRAAVARALGSTGLALAVEPLAELLEDADSGVAIAAIDALGQLEGAALFATIERALDHPDREVVKAALRALSLGRAEAAAGPLIEALGHRDWDVRQLAAEIVSELGLRAARPAVEAQLAIETDDLARNALTEARRTLSGEVH